MTTDVETTQQAPRAGSDRAGTLGRLVSGLGAVLAAAAVLALGERITATEGTGLTQQFSDQAGAITLAAILATYAAAALPIAVAKVARAVTGEAGTVVAYAGAATALLLALYYGSFAAGSIVGTDLLAVPGPGVGEAALVAANMIEFGRYAAGLALTIGVAIAFRRIPKALAISAIVLAVLAAMPFTAWFAAILIPIWLGVAGALVRPVQRATS
jgi:hypothetical protein